VPQASEVPRITPHHVFYILILLLFFPKSVRLSATAGEAKSPWGAKAKAKKRHKCTHIKKIYYPYQHGSYTMIGD
jgi:hypothetical protein